MLLSILFLHFAYIEENIQDPDSFIFSRAKLSGAELIQLMPANLLFLEGKMTESETIRDTSCQGN